MKVSAEVKRAHAVAKELLEASYAPYSNLHVAAVLKLKGIDELEKGVNVENASFGGTICAERSAFVAARSRWGEQMMPEWVVVISDHSSKTPIPPCGLCLQVMSEFAGPKFKIYLGSPRGLTQTGTLRDFLPRAFRFKQK